MTQELQPEEYARFLSREYLRGFIADGGSAVKVAVVKQPEDGFILRDAIVEESQTTGYEAAVVDAASTRVSAVHEIFFAVANDVHWGVLAKELVTKTLRDHLAIEREGALTLEQIAESSGLEPAIIRREAIRGLTDAVYKNYTLAKDFRIAMFAFCMSDLEAGAHGSETRRLIEDWLTGALRLISAIKHLAIFQKIGRHTARFMLASTAEYLRQAGHPGLLVVIDLHQLALARRQDVNGGLYYTAAAVMDAYEVLRQFIDATDETTGLMVLVIAPEQLLDDDRRGFERYPALKNRIWDEVRDRRRANPFAPMVRVSSVTE